MSEEEDKEPLHALLKEKLQTRCHWCHSVGGVLPLPPKGSILALKWTGPDSGHFLPNRNICVNFELLNSRCSSHGIHQIHYSEDRQCPVHLTSAGIVCADLQPGNIIEVDSRQLPVKIKLTDCGTAFNADSHRPGPHLGTGAPQWGCLEVVP